MADVTKLSEQEKIFLAGCIKSMILADGTIDDAELDDLDKIMTSLKFSDFDESLEKFEESVQDEEGFFKLAEQITNSASKDMILGVLDELSLQTGVAGENKTRLLKRIKEIWKI